MFPFPSNSNKLVAFLKCVGDFAGAPFPRFAASYDTVHILFPRKTREKINSGKNLKSMTTFSFPPVCVASFSFPSYLQWKKGKNNHDKSNIIWGKSGRGFRVAKLFWFRSVSRHQWNGGTIKEEATMRAKMWDRSVLYWLWQTGHFLCP